MSLRDELGEQFGEAEEEEQPEEEEQQEEEENGNTVAEEDLMTAPVDQKKTVKIIETAESGKKRLVITPLIRSVIVAERMKQLMTIKDRIGRGPIPESLKDILPQLRSADGKEIHPDDILRNMRLEDIIDAEIYQRTVPGIIKVRAYGHDDSVDVFKHFKITDFRYDMAVPNDDYFKRKERFPGRK